MLGEFQPMVGAPIAPCWLSAGSLCEVAHPPLADGLAQGTQLLFLESFFFFGSVRLLHMINISFLRGSRRTTVKTGFILTDALLHKQRSARPFHELEMNACRSPGLRMAWLQNERHILLH